MFGHVVGVGRGHATRRMARGRQASTKASEVEDVGTPGAACSAAPGRGALPAEHERARRAGPHHRVRAAPRQGAGPFGEPLVAAEVEQRVDAVRVLADRGDGRRAGAGRCPSAPRAPGSRPRRWARGRAGPTVGMSRPPSCGPKLMHCRQCSARHLLQQPQRRQRVGPCGDDQLVDGDRLVGAVRLLGDRTGAEDHHRDAEVARDEPAVAGRGPAAWRKRRTARIGDRGDRGARQR